MKRKLLFIFSLFMLPCLLFAGCKNNEKPTTEAIGETYSVNSIQTQIETEAENKNGVYIKIKASVSYSGSQEQSMVCAFAKSGDLYFFETSGNQTIYDVSNEDKIVIYTKSGTDTKWTKEEHEYGQSQTKEWWQTQIRSAFQTIETSFSAYQPFKDLKAQKTSITYAGRSCDKYEIEVAKIYAVSGKVTIIIDKATGACLKLSTNVSSEYQSLFSCFECLEFKTNYSLSVPTQAELA